MKKLLIANWKSNPDSPGRAVLLAQKIEKGIPSRNVEVVVAPPFPYLIPVAKALKKALLGAQDTFWEDTGPYTGEVSWRHLKHCGVEYIIVGHSERRIYLGETDEMINKKVLALLEQGLRPVLCIGEHEREGNEMPPIVGHQLKEALKGVKKQYLKNLVVAYEPVWAISTMPGARSDTPDNAFRALVYIRRLLSGLFGRSLADKVRIIYGGSVNSQNISGFLSEGKMDGALVGGASLDPKEFSLILKNSSKFK